jgi:hypothetical protein
MEDKLYHFNIVCEAGKDEARYNENHDEETQLWNTFCQCEDDRLETTRMPGDVESQC